VFYDVLRFFVLKPAADAGIELPHLVFVVRVLDREHGDGMRNLAESLDRFASDPLCRTVGRDKVGMLCLKRLEFLKKSVEFQIADFRIVFDIVLNCGIRFCRSFRFDLNGIDIALAPTALIASIVLMQSLLDTK
jgi:hypothetical protein